MSASKRWLTRTVTDFEHRFWRRLPYGAKCLINLGAKQRSPRRQYPGRFAKILHGDVSLHQRVTGSRHDGCRLMIKRLRGYALVTRKTRQTSKQNVEIACSQHGNQHIERAFENMNRHLRKALTEALDTEWQQRRRCCKQGADRDAPFHAVSQRRNLIVQEARLRQDQSRATYHSVAVWCRRHAQSRPFEQFDTEDTLDFLQHSCRRRLTDVESQCGRRNAAALVNRDHKFHLMKFESSLREFVVPMTYLVP